MDRVLAQRGGVRVVGVSRAVFIAGVAPGHADEPVPCLHRDHQLRTLPAPQDPVRSREGRPRRTAPAARAVDPAGRVLRAGRGVLASARETVYGVRWCQTPCRFYTVSDTV